MTKKLFFILLCLILVGCGVTKTMSIPKGSAAGFILKSDIVGMIDMYQKAVQPRCQYKIVDIKAVGTEGATVLEDWTVEACSERTVYFVKMTPSEKSGTDFAIKRMPSQNIKE